MHGLFALPSVKDGLFWHLSAPSLRCICIATLLTYLVAFFNAVLPSLRGVLARSILKAKSCSAQHNMIFQTSLQVLFELVNWFAEVPEVWKNTEKQTIHPPRTHAKPSEFSSLRSENMTCLLTTQNTIQTIFTNMHYFLLWSSCCAKGWFVCKKAVIHNMFVRTHFYYYLENVISCKARVITHWQH